ncbi:MAG: antibiotic biosynthesis monooxygenase [Myxococcales bacterium]|nr:antibiotic biosynthesis monooxygenase [Myxococcales bacterium]
MLVVVFRSKLRSEHEREYRAVAERMLALARQAPGFVSFKSFAAEDGERVSLIEFESRDAAHQWGDHAEHRDAQKLGRERFFSEYTIQVCPPLRTAEFRRD